MSVSGLGKPGPPQLPRFRQVGRSMRKKLQTYCLYIRSPEEIKFSGRKKEEKQEAWQKRATLNCVRLASGKR